MKQTELYDKIEDFLKNQMSSDERQAFTSRMNRDAGLKEEIDLHRDLMTATGESEIFNFRKIMEKAAATTDIPESQAGSPRHNGPKPPWYRSIRFFLGIAATVLLMSFAGWYFFSQPIPETPIPGTNEVSTKPASDQDQNVNSNRENEKPPENSLPQANSTPVPPSPSKSKKKNPKVDSPPSSSDSKPEFIAYADRFVGFQDVTFRGGQSPENPEETALDKAKVAFIQGEYNQVISLLADYTPSENQQFVTTYIRANAYFYLGRYEEAAEELGRKEVTGSRRFRYTAEYNLLICRLLRLPAEREKFDEALNQILNNPSHSFLKQAREVRELVQKNGN